MEITQRIKGRLKEVQDWNSIIDEVEGEATALADGPSQSKAMFELARCCEELFLDKARAMQCYQKAFKLDQSNLQALQHAREIYQEMAHLEMVTRLMGLELKNNQDPERAPALNYAYGTAMLNQRQIDTAKSFLEAASAAAPSNPVYQTRFQETIYDRSNWELALQTILDQLTAMTGGGDPLGADVAGKGSDLSALYLRGARILQQESPEDPRFLPMLFKALDCDALNEEAGFMSETILGAGGHLQHIQKLQDRRASLISDPNIKLGLLIRFGTIWQVRLNNPQMAAYFYRQALELAYADANLYFPGHLAAYRAVKAQAQESGQTDGLTALAQRGLSVVASEDEQAMLAIDAGELAWRTEGNADAGRDFFVLATAAAPGHPVLTAFQSEVGPLGEAAAAEPDTAAEDAAAAEAAAAEAAAAEAAAAEAAAAEAAAAEAAAADAAAAEAAAADAAAAEAKAAEEAAAAEAAAAEAAAAEAAAAEAKAAEEAAAAEAEAKAAAEAEAKAAAEAEAKAAREALPPVEMGDESFTADEMEIIEKAQAAEAKGGKRAIDGWRDAVNKMPDKKFPRERLKGLYIAANKWSNVADLYKDQVKRAETDEEKEPHYWELLDIYRERLKQPGLVVTTLSALEKIADAQGDVEKQLKVVEAQQAQFESMKRWPDLIGRIRRRAELVEDPTQKTELNLQAGNLFLEKFNNQAEAIKSFEAVLESDEYNGEAIGKLKELYQRRRDWEKMIAVQRKELSLIEDADERQAQLLEVARTAGQKIKKPALNIELWSAVLEHDPNNLEALEHLESMQEREKDWAALAKTLESLIELQSDEKKKSQELIKLGNLYSDKLEDTDNAIRAWEMLNELDPSNRRAQDALKKLYLAAGNMEALEEFYAKQEKWAEFIRVLEREADNADPETRTKLILKIGELYKTRLEKPDRAIRALEKGLGNDENNLTLAEALIELYEEANDEKHIAGPLGIKLGHTEDPDERQALLARLADLAERVAGDKALAFGYYRRSLDEDHTRSESVEAIRRLAPETGLWQEVVESFEAGAGKYGEDPDSLPMRLTLAEVYETQLADLEKALSTNQAILEIDADEATALASLERLYLNLGREQDLLAVLGKKLELANDDDEKRQIQTRIGSIHEQLGNHDEAVEAYKAVLDTGVEDPTVLAALDRMYVGLEKWAELADIIRRELAVTDAEASDARASLTHRLGILQQERLDDASDAVELFQQVLELQPDHEDARARLETWLDNEDLNGRVATILLPIYEAQENWPQLVRCLEIQAAGESGSARVELLMRAGAILSQAMNDSGRAFTVYSQAFDDDPENETVQQALENIAAIDDRWADYAALYETATAKDLPAELQRKLLTKVAAVYDQQLGDAEKSVAAYQRAVDIDPDNAESLEALENLHQRGSNWSELLEVYRRKVTLEQDPNMRQQLRFKIAQLQVEMLEQNEEAIVTYNEILADDDANLHAIVALDRLYLAQENWIELAEILDRQLNLAEEPHQQIELSLRLGAVRLQKLEQAEPAVELYRRVLELDPNNDAAREALESLLDNEEQQLTAAQILEPIYRGSNQWPQLINAYEIMVGRSQDPTEQIRLLHQIGELYEIGGDQPEKAFDAYGRALKIDPANEESQRRIDTLAGQMNNYADLVALYEEAIKDVVDDQLSIQVLDKVARISLGTLGDAEKAAASYERVLELDPGNFQAIDALVEVHRQTNNFEALVGAVARKAEMVESPDDRKELLLYAASVRETVMESPEGAIELYQQVLAIDDAEPRALGALEKLYLGLENWEELKEVYIRKSELAQDPSERVAALRVLGQVYDRELEDVDRAIDTYQGILDIEPIDLEALQALDRLYGQAERWHDQMNVLERAVELAPRPEAATTIRFRMGGLWEGELADTVRAVEAYREVLIHDPSHTPSIEALDRLAHGENEPMTAAQVLEPFYEQLAEWTKLIDLYEVMAKHTDDPIAKKERMHQVAGIYERQLQEFDKAFDAYAGALEIDPSNSEDTVAQMERLAEVTGDWQKFATILSEQAENVLDPLVKTAMLQKVATVQLEKLQDVDAAIGRYVEVLEDDPENLQAIQALDRIYGSLERWPDQVENLRRQISITGDEAESVALQFRMGQIYQMNMGDLPGAIEAYREILLIDPDHQPTLNSLELIFSEGQHQTDIAEILEPIYRSAERWDALVKLGEVRLGATEGESERYEIVQSVAEICEHRLGDVGQAYRWWLRGYMDDPANESVHMEIERLAEATQEWGYIVDIGERILTAEGGVSPEVQLDVLSRSARILDDKMQDYERAVHAYRQVLELDGEHKQALEALDVIYSGAEMHEELAEILRRRIGSEMDSELLVSLELRLAQTYEAHLGNVNEAIAAYNRVLDNDSRNQQALDRLEALYLSQQQWEPLFETYQKLVDIANTDEDMAGCYQRMAKLASDALDRESDSVDLWNRVLDLRGEDPLALGELALLHEAAERWDELVEVLERQVHVVEDDAGRVAVYQRMGRTYGEKLDRERNALDAWLNALEINPYDVETLDTLKKIYEDSQAWVELNDILHRLAGLGGEALGWERMRDIYAQIGSIQGEYLMQTEESIEAWQQVLQINEGDLEALAALEQLFTQEARWNEAIAVLERKSRVLTDEEEKVDVLMQIASTWEERLEDKGQAAGAYLEILEIDPAHDAAADALDAIYRETEDWESLTTLLINRAETTEDPEEEVQYLQQAAAVFENNMEDLDSAFAVLQAAFNIDYANDTTSRELERIATAANRWSDLLNEYNGLVQQIEDPLEQCELWVKIGRWYGEHLDRPDYGIQSLERALELNPESVNALRELANFHRRAGDAPSLAETLIRIVPLEQEPEVQASTLLDLAGVQEQGLQDFASSIESYRRVLEIDADSVPALEALSRLHHQEGQWSELVTVLNRRVAISEDPDEALNLRKSIGAVLRDQLQDAAGAIEVYKDIIASEPTDRDALHALEDLYIGGGNIDDYLETLEAELDATVEVAEQVGIYEKMANALIEHAEDKERASEVLEKIVELDPEQDGTYRRLEELYREMERWTDLVETYRRHADYTMDPMPKIEVLMAMGEVYDKEIQDVDRAIDTYREILEIDPDHFEAANILSKMQEAVEDWGGAVETMGRLVNLNSDPAARLDLLTRMGRVYFTKLEDQDQAEHRLNEALAIDPGHVPALITLAEIYKARMDWLKAARTLQTGSDSSENNYEKVNLAAEAGFIYLDELEDRDAAKAMFSNAMAIDPEHVKVGLQLAGMYYDEGENELALPIFDVLARKSDQLELDDDDTRDLFLKAAKCARTLGDNEKALKHYKAAHDLDATNHEVLTGMADLLFQQGDLDKCFKLYQTILVQHRDSQSDDDTVLVYFRLGSIKNQQGEARKALNYLEKALEVQPHNREVLEAVIELQSAASDWESVIQAKRVMADVAEEEERYALYQEIGGLYREKLENTSKAAEAYHGALDIHPEDLALLHTLLELYQGNKDWDNVIGIIDRIVELQDEPMIRSKYNYTAAVLMRDEMGAHDEAIDRFNMVLDDDPTMLKAFQAIDSMVTATKDWKNLERSYRKMLKRMPADGQDQLKLTLWQNLGEIYRTRMNDYKSAAAAFDIAARLDAGNANRHLILAELYEQLLDENPDEYVPKAVASHQTLISVEPFRTESYHALYNIYRKSNQVDKAFCIASVLVFLKKANSEQQAFFDKYRPQGFVQARQRLSEETMRKHVFHPDQDPYLNAIMGTIAPAIAAWQAKDVPPSMSSGDRIDIQVEPSLFARMAKYTKDVINVAVPDVYLRPKDPGDLSLMNTKRDGQVHPAMVVFSGLLRGKKEQHLAFALGRHMMDLYWPHYAYVALDRSHRNLKDVLMALLKACGVPVPGDARTMEEISRQVTGRLAPAQVDQLNRLIKNFVEAGGAVDVKKWAAAAELTNYRVGLLLCGDLTTAALMVSQEQGQLGSAISPKDKIKEMVLYSISEDYFEARRHIGLRIG